MITISLIFIINILIAFTQRKQVIILFWTLSTVLLSLYLFTSQYSVDYDGYLSYWRIANEDTSEMYLGIEVTFLYLIRLLKYFALPYISLPLSILILSLFASFTILKIFKNSNGLILSTISYPFITYLSFHSFRQSMAISFLVIAFALFQNKSNKIFKNLLVFFINFSYFCTRILFDLCI